MMKPHFGAVAYLGLFLVVAGIATWIFALKIHEPLVLIFGITFAAGGLALMIRNVHPRR